MARTNLLQQETILKNYLCRAWHHRRSLAAVRVVPLDRISVPAKDDLPAEADRIADAEAHRTELVQARLNLESNRMNLVGIRNSP